MTDLLVVLFGLAGFTLTPVYLAGTAAATLRFHRVHPYWRTFPLARPWDPFPTLEQVPPERFWRYFDTYVSEVLFWPARRLGRRRLAAARAATDAMPAHDAPGPDGPPRRIGFVTGWLVLSTGLVSGLLGYWHDALPAVLGRPLRIDHGVVFAVLGLWASFIGVLVARAATTCPTSGGQLSWRAFLGALVVAVLAATLFSVSGHELMAADRAAVGPVSAPSGT